MWIAAMADSYNTKGVTCKNFESNSFKHLRLSFDNSRSAAATSMPSPLSSGPSANGLLLADGLVWHLLVPHLGGRPRLV